MEPESIFISIVLIIVVRYLIDTFLTALNAKHFKDAVPKELVGIYDEQEYHKSQLYKKERYRFTSILSLASLLAMLLFLVVGGFNYVDVWARRFSDNDIVIALLFFSIITLASGVLNLPFSYYSTFVIEEKYGFNKTTRKTYVLDKIKGLFVTAILGGSLLSLIIWLYHSTEGYFWLYAWGVISVFSIALNMFYTRLVVPLFNKQTPLEEGVLRNKIEVYAKKVGFSLKNIFVIDGSKRSTKANAYFSGFGSEKRITLYDTLIRDLSEEEIIAVLAHEVGHYKRKHIVYQLIVSTLTTGVTLWLLSLCVNYPIWSEALGVTIPSFHVGLVAFAMLYAPISEVSGLLINVLSRKFEYQADHYAKSTYAAAPLISALKKLSKNSLSNLTPHPAYVFMYYSHPTLLQRIQYLASIPH